MGILFQPIQAALQQGNVTAKTVNHEAFDPRLFRRGQQYQCADQMREHAAFVNVSNQNHGAVDLFGKAHVGNVAFAQIDFRRTASTFHQHLRVIGTQASVGIKHRRRCTRFVMVVCQGFQIAQYLTLQNDLCARVGIGFEQYRIHVNRG